MKKLTKKKLTKKSARVQTVIAFSRTYNRDMLRSTVVSCTFVAPLAANAEQLIELAHKAGASRGDRTLAGVFELQTKAGIWSTPDDTKLLVRTGVKLSPKARFQSWKTLEAIEAQESAS